MSKTIEQSEFGKGLAYCLGLFLAHAERMEKQIEQYRKLKEANPVVFRDDDSAEMWFNGAADHLFELQVESAPENLRPRMKLFQDKCLEWRLSYNNSPKATSDDVKWAIQEAKDLLREIDNAAGILTEKGSWE